ncbi:MAG: hypothetical protein KJ607_13465, partial [Bacteroidetes bacterium]|nr:hypothetical protein [Bacteroidota bacterium]
MIRIVTALSVSLFFLISGMYAQTEYSSGNAAYRAEKELGYNPVTIAGGTRIYEFDYDKDVYRFEGWILIPDLIDDPEGN